MVGAKTICEVDARDEMIIGISRRRRRRVINWSSSARVGEVSCNCGMNATMKYGRCDK